MLRPLHRTIPRARYTGYSVLILLCLIQTGAARAQGFRVDDVRVGHQSVNYIDPEFFSEGNRMVFQSTVNGVPSIWIAELDPVNGTLMSVTGKDVLVDSNVATLGPTAQTNNGPEWGLDANGEAVFYSKKDVAGVVQYWRASDLSGAAVLRTQLTHVPSPNGEGAIQGVVRQDARLSHTMFYYRYSICPECPGINRWAHEHDADAIHVIQYFNAAAFAPSFIPGTEDIAFSRYTSQSTSEVYRLHTATDAPEQISNEPSDSKSSVIAFLAPEYGNELMYAYVRDKRELVILRKEGAGYKRFASLDPADSLHPYMYSPEIFQVNGTTYFAVLMQDTADYLTLNRGAIYVLGFGNDSTQRLTRRIDLGTTAKRWEPEVYIGSDEVFVFYNASNQLRRARTGIRLGTSGIDRIPGGPDLHVAPNPARDLVHITAAREPVVMYDLFGRVVWRGSAHGTMTVDLSSVPVGVYIVRSGDTTQRLLHIR